MELAQICIKESMQDAGTWTYGFLSSIHAHTKQLKTKDFEKFISELFKFIMEPSTTDLQRFKISQMLSTIKFQNIHQANYCYVDHKTDVTKFCSTLDTSPLAKATKKLLLSMFVAQEQFPGSKKYKAFSVSPVVFQVNPPKQRRNTYNNE